VSQNHPDSRIEKIRCGRPFPFERIRSWAVGWSRNDLPGITDPDSRENRASASLSSVRYVTVELSYAAIFAVDSQRRGKDPIAKRPGSGFDLGMKLGALGRNWRAAAIVVRTSGVRHRIRAPKHKQPQAVQRNKVAPKHRIVSYVASLGNFREI